MSKIYEALKLAERERSSVQSDVLEQLSTQIRDAQDVLNAAIRDCTSRVAAIEANFSQSLDATSGGVDDLRAQIAEQRQRVQQAEVMAAAAIERLAALGGEAASSREVAELARNLAAQQIQRLSEEVRALATSVAGRIVDEQRGELQASQRNLAARLAAAERAQVEADRRLGDLHGGLQKSLAAQQQSVREIDTLRAQLAPLANARSLLQDPSAGAGGANQLHGVQPAADFVLECAERQAAPGALEQKLAAMKRHLEARADVLSRQIEQLVYEMGLEKIERQRAAAERVARSARMGADGFTPLAAAASMHSDGPPPLWRQAVAGLLIGVALMTSALALHSLLAEDVSLPAQIQHWTSVLLDSASHLGIG